MILILSASPSTSRTEWPACSASDASSVAVPIASRPSSMASSSTSRRERLRRLRQINRFARDRPRDDSQAGRGGRFLDGVARLKRGDRRAALCRRVDDARKKIGRRKRPRGVVNDDHAGALGDLRERVGHRILPPRSRHRRCARAFFDEIRNGGGDRGEVGRKRDDDLVDAFVALDEIEAALKNGAIAKRRALLRDIATRAAFRGPRRQGWRTRTWADYMTD